MSSVNDIEPMVSDRAVVRYLERVVGVDVEALRREILHLNERVAVGELGDGKYPLGNGFRAVVKNNVVVTVLKP